MTKKQTKSTPVSAPMTLNTYDWKSIGKGALIAAGGAFVAFITPYLGTIDWSTYGKYGVFIGAFAAFIINFIRVLVKGK